MLKHLNFSTKKNNLFITSDTHFHHNKEWIYGLRNFKSMKEHDDEIIRRWNSVVGLTDNVLHLGDFMCEADEDLFREYIYRLNGHIYILFGNHNSGVSSAYKNEIQRQYKKEIEVYPLEYEKKVTFVDNFVWGKIDDTNYVACHFAIRTWPYNQKGTLHFCGHSHSNDKESNPDTGKIKRLDCGIDNFKQPVPFQELKTIMSSKGYDVTDHHQP